MKKRDWFYFILIMAIFILFITWLCSCIKEKEFSGCWRCVVKTEYYDRPFEPHNIYIYSEFDFCEDFTKIDADCFIESNTWVDSLNKISQKASCKKLECW